MTSIPDPLPGFFRFLRHDDLDLDDFINEMIQQKRKRKLFSDVNRLILISSLMRVYRELGKDSRRRVLYFKRVEPEFGVC